MANPCLEREREHSGRMHIALASNEVYSPGLLVAVLSILAATSRRGGVTFHILDGGLEQTTWERLEREISRGVAGASIRLWERSYDICKASAAFAS